MCPRAGVGRTSAAWYTLPVRSFAFASLILLGCSTSRSPTPSGVEVQVAPAVSAAFAATTAEPVASNGPSRPTQRRAAEPEGDFAPWARLGTTCSAGIRGCGTKGRVAVFRDRKLPPGTIPSDVCDLIDVSGSATGRNRVAACATRGLLVIHRVSSECDPHVDGGEGLLGLIAEMTPEQLMQAQEMTGFSPAPVLATEQAWTEAIAKAAHP